MTAEQPLYNAGAHRQRAPARDCRRTAPRSSCRRRGRTSCCEPRVSTSRCCCRRTRSRKSAGRRRQPRGRSPSRRASYDEGKLPVTDRTEARARFDGIDARESMALDDLELRRAALFELTGLPADNLKRLPASAPLQPFDAGRLDAAARQGRRTQSGDRPCSRSHATSPRRRSANGMPRRPRRCRWSRRRAGTGCRATAASARRQA